MKVLLAATVVVIMSATTYRSFYIDADFSKWSEILSEKFTEVRDSRIVGDFCAGQIIDLTACLATPFHSLSGIWDPHWQASHLGTLICR